MLTGTWHRRKINDRMDKKTHIIKHAVSPVLDLDNGIVNAYSIK